MYEGHAPVCPDHHSAFPSIAVTLGDVQNCHRENDIELTLWPKQRIWSEKQPTPQERYVSLKVYNLNNELRWKVGRKANHGTVTSQTIFTFLSNFRVHVFVSISLDQWQLFICIIICSGLKRKLTPKFHGSPDCNNQCFITYAKQNLRSYMKFLGEFLLLRKLKSFPLLNRFKIFPSSL